MGLGSSISTPRYTKPHIHSMKGLITALVLLAMVQQGLSIYIVSMSTQQQCFHKHIKRGQFLRGNYVISGYDEDQIEFYVYDEQGKDMVAHKQQTEGDFEFHSNSDQTYQICFLPLDSNKKVISFDFSLPEE